MQIKLTFKTTSELSLPLGHHAALQGFIYSILKSNPEYAEFLHDTGYADGAHSFKLFVFSTLKGKHYIEKPRIIYTDKIYLEIRSPQKEFCELLIDTLQKNYHFDLARQEIELSECSFSNRVISEDELDIRLLSPLTLSTTYYENEKKKTRFISPSDDDFAESSKPFAGRSCPPIFR